MVINKSFFNLSNSDAKSKEPRVFVCFMFLFDCSGTNGVSAIGKGSIFSFRISLIPFMPNECEK